jgi:uncharacterized RDD family membrane protein YckC
MKCPRCGLINDDDAVRCDCGYDFASRTVKKSYLTAKDREHLDVLSDTGDRPSRWRRLFGLLVDLVLVWLVTVLLLVFGPVSAVGYVRFSGAVVGIVLLGLQWGLWGRSVGMVLFGLRLTGPDGGPPGLSRGFARAFSMLLGTFLGLVWWPVLARRDQRGLHDLLAHTWVVRA